MGFCSLLARVSLERTGNCENETQMFRIAASMFVVSIGADIIGRAAILTGVSAIRFGLWASRAVMSGLGLGVDIATRYAAEYLVSRMQAGDEATRQKLICWSEPERRLVIERERAGSIC